MQRAPRAREHRDPAKPRLGAADIDTRELVLARDEHRCVRCGVYLESSPFGYSLQHRIARGMGGRKDERIAAMLASPANLLTMCGSGVTGCHGWAEAHPALAGIDGEGYALPRTYEVDPVTVPVRTWRGWRLFGHDGTTVPCPPPPGAIVDARGGRG